MRETPRCDGGSAIQGEATGAGFEEFVVIDVITGLGGGGGSNVFIEAKRELLGAVPPSNGRIWVTPSKEASYVGLLPPGDEWRVLSDDKIICGVRLYAR